MTPKPLDAVDAEALADFLNHVGVLSTPCVDEDWERQQRATYCTHHIPKQSCYHCKKDISKLFQK